MKPVILLCSLTFLFSASCQKDPSTTTADYLVFGTFYGMCAGGELCVEIFKIDHKNLWEDRNDNYPDRSNFYDGKFEKLSNDKFEATKDLLDKFPQELLNEKESTLGCPDCVDQGGMYVEYKKGNTHKFWIIDNSTSAIPEYLHSFADELHTKVTNLR
ncbi:hypothetical protein GC194_15740 [bacterium]|nr:hypothetical protein [bacterium]